MLPYSIRSFVVSFVCVGLSVAALGGLTSSRGQEPASADAEAKSKEDAVKPSELTFPPKLRLTSVTLKDGEAQLPERRFQYAFGTTQAYYHGVVEFTLTNEDAKAVVIDPLSDAKAWLLNDNGEAASGLTQSAQGAAFRLVRVGDNQPVTLQTGQTWKTTAVFELAFLPTSPRAFCFALELGRQMAIRRFQLGRTSPTPLRVLKSP